MTDTELLKLIAKGVAFLLREQHFDETKEGIYADNKADLLANQLDPPVKPATDGMK